MAPLRVGADRALRRVWEVPTGRQKAGTAADGRHLAWAPMGRQGTSQRVGSRFGFAGPPLHLEWRV